jgi:Mrp family chromosome partitioning ATPase
MYQLSVDELSQFVTVIQWISIDVVIIVLPAAAATAAVSVGAPHSTGAVLGQCHAMCPTLWYL